MAGALVSLLCSSGCSATAVAASLAFYPPMPPSYELTPVEDTTRSPDGAWLRALGLRNTLAWRTVDGVSSIPYRNVWVTEVRTRRKRVVPMFCILYPGAHFTILHSHGNAADCGLMKDLLVDMAINLRVNVVSYDYTGYGSAMLMAELPRGLGAVGRARAILAAAARLPRRWRMPRDGAPGRSARSSTQPAGPQSPTPSPATAAARTRWRATPLQQVPSEVDCFADAEAVLDAVLASPFCSSADQVILYGQSLGSGPAVHLASARAVRGLILHSPIASGMRVVTESRALGCLDIFDNLGTLRKRGVRVGGVFLMHGQRDEEVPMKHGEALYAALPDRLTRVQKPWFPAMAGHNDIAELYRGEYYAKLRAFVTRLAGPGSLDYSKELVVPPRALPSIAAMLSSTSDPNAVPEAPGRRVVVSGVSANTLTLPAAAAASGTAAASPLGPQLQPPPPPPFPAPPPARNWSALLTAAPLASPGAASWGSMRTTSSGGAPSHPHSAPGQGGRLQGVAAAVAAASSTSAAAGGNARAASVSGGAGVILARSGGSGGIGNAISTGGLHLAPPPPPFGSPGGAAADTPSWGGRDRELGLPPKFHSGIINGLQKGSTSSYEGGGGASVPSSSILQSQQRGERGPSPPRTLPAGSRSSGVLSAKAMPATRDAAESTTQPSSSSSSSSALRVVRLTGVGSASAVDGHAVLLQQQGGRGSVGADVDEAGVAGSNRSGPTVGASTITPAGGGQGLWTERHIDAPSAAAAVPAVAESGGLGLLDEGEGAGRSPDVKDAAVAGGESTTQAHPVLEIAPTGAVVILEGTATASSSLQSPTRQAAAVPTTGT